MATLFDRELNVMVMQAADGSTISAHYSATRILVSFFISCLGAYTCTSMCEQLRASYMVGLGSFKKDMKWFSLMGISLGAIGIWSMHFIGMSSLTLRDDNGDEVQMSFNLGISIISLIVVIITTTLGVMVAANDPMFMKTKGEILEMFLQDTSKMSMQEVRQMKNARLLKLITTKNLGFLIAGGFIAGSGVCVMHFIGMEAMRFQGRITWNIGIVFVAVLIAVVASTAAFWILFRLLSLFPSRESLRLVSSFIMGVAVCGMHYTGMVAANFEVKSAVPVKLASSFMQKKDAYIPVIISVVFMLVLMTIILLSDLRSIVHKYNLQVKKVKNPDWKVSQEDSSIRRYMSKFKSFKIYPSFTSFQERNRENTVNSTNSNVEIKSKYAVTSEVAVVPITTDMAEIDEENCSVHSTK
jgi:diguanylate cyclase